jgi:hypothetical protein
LTQLLVSVKKPREEKALEKREGYLKLSCLFCILSCHEGEERQRERRGGLLKEKPESRRRREHVSYFYHSLLEAL